MVTPMSEITFFNTENTTQTRRSVAEARLGALGLRPEDGMIALECCFGTFTFARPTGRTRNFWGIACPTFERFEVETVVIDGAIWGVPGDRIPGTFATRPENLA